MSPSQKQRAIKKHALDMLKVDRLLNSGAVDIDGWDEYDKPMILPKSILCAVLESESHQYSAKGTSYEKHIKKEVKNFQYFI